MSNKNSKIQNNSQFKLSNKNNRIQEMSKQIKILRQILVNTINRNLHHKIYTINLNNILINQPINQHESNNKFNSIYSDLPISIIKF